MSEVTQNSRGLVVHDNKLTFANRDTALVSASEASPQPGSPLGAVASNRLNPSISGAQDDDVDVEAFSAGFPSVDPAKGCRVGIKLGTEAASETRGWNGAGDLNRWDLISTFDARSILNVIQADAVTVPSSQRIVVVFENTVASDNVNKSRTLNPNTNVWAAAVDLPNGHSSPTIRDLAVTIMPDETLLCVQFHSSGTGNTLDLWEMIQSADEGATWSTYADDIFGDPTTLPTGLSDKTGDYMSRMVAAGTDVMFTRSHNSGAGFVQFASNSLGTSFTQVGSEWTSGAPRVHSLVAMKSGRIGMAYTDAALGTVSFKVVGAASSRLEAATAVLLFTAAVTSVATWQDYDGAVYVAANSTDQIRLFRSIDDGETFTELTTESPHKAGDANTMLVPMAATSANGTQEVICRTLNGSGGTVYDRTIVAVTLGGWSNLEKHSGARGWFNGTDGRTWLPYEWPDTISSWTATGTGTNAAVTTEFLMRVTTAAQVRFFSQVVSAKAIEMLSDNQPVSGGLSVTAPIIGSLLQLSNGIGGAGGRTWTAAVCQNLTQYGLFDTGNGAALGGVITHNISGRIEIKVYLEQDATFTTTSDGIVSSWYRAKGDSNWIIGHDRVAVPAFVSTSTGLFAFGNIDSGTATSWWGQFHVIWSGSAFGIAPRTRTYSGGGNDPKGKNITSRPYPIPDAGTPLKHAFMALLAGPATVGETWDIDTSHGFDLANMYSERSPSPLIEWRSTDTTEQIVAAWTFAEVHHLGNDALAMVLRNCNAANVLFEGRNGGAGAWTTLGDWSTFQVVSVVFDGDSFISGGTSGYSRYVHENELAGGWFVDFSGTTRVINRNTAGVLNDTTSGTPTRQARVWFDGADGTEDDTFPIVIYNHSGVLVFDPGSTLYEQYQIRIPAGTTPQGYFKIGSFRIGGYHPFGVEYSRGWQWQQRFNTDSDTDDAGTTRVIERGPPLRSLSVSWPDPTDAINLNQELPDWLGLSSGTLRLATYDDVGTHLMGIMEYTQSGEHTVAVLASVPDTLPAMITNPQLWLHGRITNIISIENVLGEEGVSELSRVASITVDEQG